MVSRWKNIGDNTQAYQSDLDRATPPVIGLTQIGVDDPISSRRPKNYDALLNLVL